MTKKASVPQTSKAAVDSAEIDDLFSIFSSKKAKIETAPDVGEKNKSKNKTEKQQKNAVKAELEVKDDDTIQDTSEVSCEEDLKEESSSKDQEPVAIKKGSRYDPSRNDFPFPAVVEASARHDDHDFFDSRGLKRKTRPLTEDGLPIYTTIELRIGLGGGTDLCPFDCNCCF